MGYPEVYYVTYREYLMKSKAFIDNVSFQQGMFRRVLYNMIMGNPYIKKEHKPKRERDLYLLANETYEEINYAPTTMTREEADFFEACGYNIYEGHILN